jgi:diguanylate cyclase (GGDEF)-like protein
VWVTARRLLAAVRQQLPTESTGITAVGYRGFDLALSDPAEAKERYTRLMAARGSTLRGICRSRTPVQASFDEAAGDNAEEAALGGKFAVVPLSVAKPGWGALMLERAAWEEFSAEELKSVQELCEVAERALDDALSQAELRKRAEIDPLTGVYNRRAFDAMIDKLFVRALETRQQISVLFLDLDLFKQINDKHGHATGDECLRSVCDATRRELAAGDILARYGGEEFVVVLPGQTPDQARQVAERIRASVAQLRVDSEKGVIKMTISIGLAGRGAEEEDPQAMIGRADKALYVAKRNGRNQVQVAPTYGQGSAGNMAPPPEAPIGF